MRRPLPRCLRASAAGVLGAGALFALAPPAGASHSCNNYGSAEYTWDDGDSYNDTFSSHTWFSY